MGIFKKLAIAALFVLANRNCDHLLIPKAGFIRMLVQLVTLAGHICHDIGRPSLEEALGDQVETVKSESVQYGPEAEMAILKWHRVV